MAEKNRVLNENQAGANPEAGLQAAPRVQTKKFCRQCGKLMTFSFEKNVWICPSGCPQ